MTFNEFLLEKCWIIYGQYYKDREDFDKHYQSGEVIIPVTHTLSLYDEFLNGNPLPSRFKHGDKVTLDFEDAGDVHNCTIIKVHFSESKVLYDVEVAYKYLDSSQPNVKGFTRIYNVDSCYVQPEK